MKLRARWLGAPPRVGDYLMSEVRPRFAYRVGRVEKAHPKVAWNAADKIEIHQLNLIVDRVALLAVPEHARVHAWKWDKRQAKRCA